MRTDLAVLLVISSFGLPGLVVVHELGHALAALATGIPIRRFHIARSDAPGPLGFVSLDLRGVTPGRMVVVAAAGPAASALAAAVAAAAAYETRGLPCFALVLLAAVSASLAVGNLVATGGADGRWSDGDWIRNARRAGGATLPLPPPAPAAPPPPAAPRPPLMGPAYAVVLGLVVVVCVAGGMWGPLGLLVLVFAVAAVRQRI